MPTFIGFVPLSSTLKIGHVTRNGSSVPTDADSSPTYRIYGTSLMTNGTGSLSLKDSGTITGATNASPIVITSTGHGLSNGTRVTVASVGGNTAANGTFTVANVTSNTFELSGSTGNGSYTSGGTWHVTGLYSLSITPTSGNGYAAGSNYDVLVTSTVSSTTYSEVYRFGVV